VTYAKIDSPTLLIRTLGHPTYYVREGDVFKIGRGPSNDLSLMDLTVSRKHAIIKWDTKYPRIADLKSTAGLIVDGEHVLFKHLHALHVLSLGQTRIELDYARGQSDTPTEVENPTVSSAILQSLDESDDVILFYEQGAADRSGFLETTAKIQKLLTHLELRQRTGTLTLTNNSMVGKILFAVGKIKKAICGSVSGRHALQQLCGFSSAQYHWTVSFDVQETSMNESAACFIRGLSKAATMRRNSRGLFKRAPRFGD